MFEAILEQIKTFDTIIIHRHYKPDGDAMGSQIGMKQLLMENFPEKTVYAVGDEPRFFSFMEEGIGFVPAHQFRKRKPRHLYVLVKDGGS